MTRPTFLGVGFREESWEEGDDELHHALLLLDNHNLLVHHLAILATIIIIIARAVGFPCEAVERDLYQGGCMAMDGCERTDEGVVARTYSHFSTRK